MKALGAVYAYVRQSGLPSRSIDLVFLRVSQINVQEQAFLMSPTRSVAMEDETDLRPASSPSESCHFPPNVSLYLSCAVCQREIPVSAAVSPESSDYVMHFCGLECYEQWRNG